MRTVSILWCVSLLWFVTPLAAAGQQDTFDLVGVVRNAEGHGADGISVRLQQQGDQRVEVHKTDSAGRFTFTGLKPGLYVVSALNEEVSVKGDAGETKPLELTLGHASGDAGSANHNERGPAAAMEFSDLPNFTIAAVTDWTAAGGHGSDTSLRASETLTQETLRLKPEPKAGVPSGPAASELEQRLREAVERSPRSYKANEELGRFELSAERYSDAVALLETANEVDPKETNAEYELALALNRSGDPVKAHAHIARLLAEGDKPEWHRLSGEVEEKLGDSLGAVQAFERAVREDQSEENYFAWGTELLRHRAIWQAKDVFEAGVKVNPNSALLLTALGAALFSAALYDEAGERLCEASDLIPNDAQPYLFMGQVEVAAPNPLPCIEKKLQRFVELQPKNALANYYFAMAYWKQHGKTVDGATLHRVEDFLSRAVEDDPACSSAYLQLGVIEASLSDFRKAAGYYEKAIEADPLSSEAHYRLGVAYDRLGEKDRAEKEFHAHDELEKKQAATVEQQRREVKQFLVLVGGDPKGNAAQP